MSNEKLIYFLNQLLSNQFVMFVKLHRYSWYIKGSNIFQLHEVFEEMSAMFVEELDLLATRILALNGQPYATMVKYVKEATVTEASADNLENEMMNQLIQDYEQIASEIRTIGMIQAKAVNDEPTIDLLVNSQMKLEKYIWKLKAYEVS